jgi:quinol monooxygenase YgiN
LYIVVWRFRIRPSAEQAFLEGYGPNGSWARLFRQGTGFRKTDLARSVEDLRVFYTLDEWNSEAAYGEFREAFRQQYEALDQSFEGLTEDERLVGVLEVPESAL